MPLEKSAGAIVFRKEKKENYYLLLHYPSSVKSSKDYWDLPKGHIKKREKEIETVKREIEEETGLKEVEFIDGFKKQIRYFFKFRGKNILKFVIFYLAETKIKKINISNEHLGYEWLSFEKAVEKLTFKNTKEILEKADDFISKKSI